MQYKIILFLLCFLGAQPFAYSQEGEGAQEWNPVSAGPATTWTAQLCGKGKFVVQPIVSYNRTRGTFDSDGHSNALPKGDKESQFQQQLFAQYGITDKLEIDAQGVYQENYAKEDGVNAHAHGWGDSFLFTRYALLKEKKLMPQITGLWQLKVPTGKYQHGDPEKLDTDLMGTGSWDNGFGLIATKKFKPFLFHADAIYSVPSEVKIDGVNTRHGNYLNYDASVEYFLPKGFNLMLELNGLAQANEKENGVESESSHVRSLAFAPGIGWSNDRIQTLLVYQRVLTGANTDANDSIVATFVYTF